MRVSLSFAWVLGVLAVCASEAHALPVVLVPGFMGQRDMRPIGPYFIGGREALEAAGFEVYEVALPPVNSVEARGEFLARAIAAARAHSGAEQVIVIAHSQGGVDVRAALDAGAAPDVAAVATLSSPHHGTDVADAALALPSPLVNATLTVLGRIYTANQAMPRVEPDVHAALFSLSRAGMADFNARHPLRADVPFFTVAAASGPFPKAACSDGAWRAVREDNAFHPLLRFGRAMILSQRHIANDGVVPTESMRIGDPREHFLGCIGGDHGDWLGWGDLDAGAFLVQLARGLDDVARARDAHAMDAHVPALASIVGAVPL